MAALHDRADRDRKLLAAVSAPQKAIAMSLAFHAGHAQGAAMGAGRVASQRACSSQARAIVSSWKIWLVRSTFIGLASANEGRLASHGRFVEGIIRIKILHPRGCRALVATAEGTNRIAPASLLLSKRVLRRIHARASCGSVGERPKRQGPRGRSLAANAQSGQGHSGRAQTVRPRGHRFSTGRHDIERYGFLRIASSILDLWSSM